MSDLDVIFLFDDDDDMAPSNYARLAQRFITWMTTHTPAGILFDIDTALRPDGASGMLVSSSGAFERYQLSSAWIWEHQALTRARFCAGDAGIGARFEAIREQVLRQDRSSRAGDRPHLNDHSMPSKDRPLAEPVTLLDVARLAGVSAATVSRILNGTARVTAEKRLAVETAIERLQFRPNFAAQRLCSVPGGSTGCGRWRKSCRCRLRMRRG